MLNTILPRTVEGALTAIGAAGGAVWAAALQTVEPVVWWYGIFVAADLITGIWAGIKTVGFKSTLLAFGMMKKAIAFGIIILAHGLDVSFSVFLRDLPLFQGITLLAYTAGEFGSIVENIERAGYGDALPPMLRRLFTSLEARLESAVDSQLDKAGLKDDK